MEISLYITFFAFFQVITISASINCLSAGEARTSIISLVTSLLANTNVILGLWNEAFLLSTLSANFYFLAYETA